MQTISAAQAFKMAFHTELGLLAFYIPEDSNPYSDGLYMVQDMAPSGAGYEIAYGHSSGMQYTLQVAADFPLLLPIGFSLEV
jgi:hypothetical protein